MLKKLESLKYFDLFREIFFLLRYLKKNMKYKKKRINNKYAKFNIKIISTLLFANHNVPKLNINKVLFKAGFINTLHVYTNTKINFFQLPAKIHKNKKVGIIILSGNYKYSYSLSYLNENFIPVVTLSTGFALKFFAFNSKCLKRTDRGRKYLFIYFSRLLRHHIFFGELFLIIKNIKKRQFEIIDFFKKIKLFATLLAIYVKYLRYDKTKFKNYKSIKKRTRKKLLLKNKI